MANGLVQPGAFNRPHAEILLYIILLLTLLRPLVQGMTGPTGDYRIVHDTLNR